MHSIQVRKWNNFFIARHVKHGRFATFIDKEPEEAARGAARHAAAMAVVKRN